MRATIGLGHWIRDATRKHVVGIIIGGGDHQFVIRDEQGKRWHVWKFNTERIVAPREGW